MNAVELKKGLIYAVVSAVCLGTLAIFGKLCLARGMEVFEIIQYRFGFGSLALFAYFAATAPQMLRIRPRALGIAAVLGLVIYPIQSVAFMTALKYIPASTTSLIYYLYPLGTTLLAAMFLGLKMSRAIAASLAMVLAGCALIFHQAFADQADMRGVLWALLCMCVYCVYLTVIQLAARHEDVRRISIYVIGFMALIFSVLSSPLKVLELDLQGLALAIGLGVLPTALAVSLLYRAVDKVGSGYVSIFSTLEPLTTVTLATVVLGEKPSWVQALGMLAIVAGIVWPNLGLIKSARAVGTTEGSPPTKREQ